MKKQFISMLVILLSVSGIFFSCSDKKKSVGELQFDSISVNKTVHLFGDTAKPACNLIIKFVYPVQASDTLLKSKLTSYFISAVFGDKYAGGQPQGVITDFVTNYVDEYRKTLEPTYTEDMKNNLDKGMTHSWYSYYNHIQSNVQWYNKSLLVYRVHHEEYTGGAHGMYSNHFLNIDLITLNKLRLSDLFDVPDYHEILTDLIWNQLMADNNVTTHEALEDLGFGITGEIAPMENFYLSKEGITFYYNVYEIAPYSHGPVSVTIPFAMIEKITGTHPIIKELKE